jgi:hypothetical protein
MSLKLVRGSIAVISLALALPSCTIKTVADDDDSEGEVESSEDAGKAPNSDSEGSSSDDPSSSEDSESDPPTETSSTETTTVGEGATASDAGTTDEQSGSVSADASADAGDGGNGSDKGADGGDGGQPDIEADLNLPPDPGESGDDSVEGIDQNDNTIRDDVERNIGFRYYPNRRLVDLIWRLAKLDQTMVLGVTDPNVVSGAFDEKKLVLGCILAELDGDIAELLKIVGDVSALVFDTGARLGASRQIEAQLGGQVITLPTDMQVTTYCGGNTESAVSLDAETTQLCSASGGTTVTLSNDAFNRHDKSLVHLMAIRDEAVAVAGEDAAQYSYRLLYADSERLWVSGTTDEALLSDAESLGDFTQARPRADLDSVNRWLSGAGSVPEFIQAPIAGLTALGAGATVIEEADLNGHVAGLTADATVGNRIIALGHGLGSVYLNAAYNQLIDSLPEFSGSMQQIALGTPAVTLVGTSEPTYLNLEGDWAVGTAYKALNPNPLPANAQNETNTADVSNHELYLSYLAGDATKAATRSLLADAFEGIPFPEQRGSNGIITVTLTWGEQPDVDLHTFEPDGTHVDYQSKIGTAGELDVDDTEQFGPEHYTVSCDKLVAGTYKLAVNYFRGDVPETAVVNIVAGTQSRTINVKLDTAHAEEGNDTPIAVADIKVSAGEEAGDFVFGIKSLIEEDEN